MIPNWQNWAGFDYVFFDCDSTLSTIEGIDELARKKGKFDEVKQLTNAAMDGEVHLQSVYDRRLALLNPTRAEIRSLELNYRETIVPHAAEVLAALQYVGKTVFVISGGLLAAVRPFGVHLGVPPENIRAVELDYDSLSGEWWDYQQDQWGKRPDVAYKNPKATPLIETDGKADVVRDLLAGRQGRTVLIGDGVSDLAARPAITSMIGFGGVISRERVLSEADLFIKANTLAPLLPLALTADEQAKLTYTRYAPTLQHGLAVLQGNQVVFNLRS